MNVGDGAKPIMYLDCEQIKGKDSQIFIIPFKQNFPFIDKLNLYIL